jgi:hypothetical protein
MTMLYFNEVIPKLIVAMFLDLSDFLLIASALLLPQSTRKATQKFPERQGKKDTVARFLYLCRVS